MVKLSVQNEKMEEICEVKLESLNIAVDNLIVHKYTRDPLIFSISNPLFSMVPATTECNKKFKGFMTYLMERQKVYVLLYIYYILNNILTVL